MLAQRYQQAQPALAQLEQQKARVELQARNLQHNQHYRQFLQQFSVAVPPPLWLIALDDSLQGWLQLRGFSLHSAAIAQFEQRLTAMPLLLQHQLEEVVQSKDDLLAFTLMAWGRDGYRLTSLAMALVKFACPAIAGDTMAGVKHSGAACYRLAVAGRRATV